MPDDNDGELGRAAPLALVTDPNAAEIAILAEIARNLIKGNGAPVADLTAAAEKAMPLAPVIPIRSIARVFAQAMRERRLDDYENAILHALGIGPTAIKRLLASNAISTNLRPNTTSPSRSARQIPTRTRRAPLGS